jgi:hypothetical protein
MEGWRIYLLIQSNMHLNFKVVEPLHGHPQLTNKRQAPFYNDILMHQILSLQCAHATNSMIAYGRTLYCPKIQDFTIRQ